MTAIVEAMMTDDQGVTGPVVPTDAAEYDLPPTYDMEMSYPDAVARVHELEAENADLRAQLASAPQGQGNFVSARVQRHEDMRDEAAIWGWERATGETWTPEPFDHVDPVVQAKADDEKAG